MHLTCTNTTLEGTDMAAPAPSWNTCRVVGTWHNLDGSRRAGTYKVTIPVRVTNATDDVIIPAGVAQQGALEVDSGAPSLDIQVPSNMDPDNSPNGWQPVIEVTFPDAQAERYVIDTPVDGEVNLRTVVLATSLPAPLPVLIRDVPGGLASLDANGKLKASQVPDGLGGGGMDPDAVDEHLATTEALADVARTGAYSDLTGKPTIPTLPTLATVATTGAYSDLSGRPTIPSVPGTLPPTDGSVTAAKMASGLVAMTTAERSKLTALPSDAQSASQVDARIATVVGSAPAALDTLVEFAAAINNDSSFAATTTAALATKANTSDVTAALAGKASTATATATAPGLVELATTTEVTTGTDTARAVTPAGLKVVADTKVGSPNATVTGLAHYPSVADLPATGVVGVVYFTDAE